MAESQVVEGQTDRIAEFKDRIEELRRDGVGTYPPLGGRTPWGESAESRKLEAIVEESMRVWVTDASAVRGDDAIEVIPVPGTALLEAVERNVDYDGLSAAQRVGIEDLLARLDAGQIGSVDADGKDYVAMGLARVVGIGHFDDMVGAARVGEDRSWGHRPEALRVEAFVDAAREAAAPGAYALAAIEREVDYSKLSPWRRNVLEHLRDRIDRGELDGENPNPSYQGDRAELALRLGELEARVEDAKRAGYVESEPWFSPWREISEKNKFDLIMGDIRELHLESQSAAYHVLGREVDMTRVRKDQWWEFEDGRQEAWPRPAADTNGFDRVAADPRRQWYSDGHGDGVVAWEVLSASRQIEYLAGYAARHEVSFERFAEAASRTLGMARGREFTGDDAWQLRRQFRYAHLGFSEDRDVSPPYPRLKDRPATPSEIVRENSTARAEQGNGQGHEREEERGGGR